MTHRLRFGAVWVVAVLWIATATGVARAQDPLPAPRPDSTSAGAADTLAGRAVHPVAASLRGVALRSKLTVAAGGPTRIRGRYAGSTETALQLRLGERDSSSIEFAAIRGLWVENKMRTQGRVAATLAGAVAGGFFLASFAKDNDYDVAGRPIEGNETKRFLFGAVLGAGAGWALSDLLWHGRGRPRRLYP